MANVLITGGSGFIGTNLVEHYAERGHQLVNVDITAPRNSAHLRYWTQVDVRDGQALRKIIDDFSPNLIVHMAARTDFDGASLSDYSANTDGVRIMIEAARHLPRLHRVIFASSMLVCALGYRPQHDGDYCPTTLYGESKVLGERCIREFATGLVPWTIVRPTSLWGPWFDVPYRNFFNAVAKRMYLHPKGLIVRRSYGFVLNAVHQLSRIAECADRDLVEGKTLYLADYEPVDLFQWAREISARFGVPPPREVPVRLLWCLASVGTLLKHTGLSRHPLLTSFRLKNLLTDAVFDVRDLERIAGATPYRLSEGVAMTVDWMRATMLRTETIPLPERESAR